jgi:hypothetical protein
MQAAFSARDILASMITPAVLISASGSLAISTSNRLNRVVDRIRALSAEAERLLASGGGAIEARERLIADQLTRLADRVLILRSALTGVYLAIGLLVSASIAIGLVAVFGWSYGWVPVVLGLCGASALLYSSVLLIREARLSVSSLLQELAYARELAGRRGAGR